MTFNIIELAYNLAILVALSVVSGFIKQCKGCKGQRGALLQGLLFGVACIIGMMRPVILGPGIFFDGRSVMLCLCGLFFGPVAAITASALALVYRISAGGSGVVMGILVILTSATWGVLFHKWWGGAVRPLTTKRLLSFGLLVHIGMVLLMFTLPTSRYAIEKVGIPVLLIYPLATLLIGKILFSQDQALQTVEALMQSEKKYRALVDNFASGVVVHSLDTGVIFANAMAADILGMTQDEMVGKTAGDPGWMFLQEDGLPLPLKDYPVNRVVASGVGLHNQIVGVLRQDRMKPLWVLCNAYPTTGFHGETQITVTFSDITDHIEAEEERERLTAQLQQSQKMESLGSLAGGIAHDINNVLAAILGMAEIGRDDQQEGSRAWKSFDTIIKAATRGGVTVKSLLTFARQSPVEAVNTEIVNMNMVLLEEARLLERTTLSKVKLDLQLANDLWPIHGDVSALTHAFMNLCINSVDAMPEGGTISLRSRNNGHGYIEIIVADNGDGMSKEVLAKAMDPFFTTKAVGKGTGLGLSMVFTTVKAHKGLIDIKSEVGKGTTITLKFPSCTMEHSEETGSIKVEATPNEALKRLSILLVDDDELIQSAMGEILETMGHNPVIAGTAEEALVRLESGLLPAVIILDMNMPGMGGAAALPKIRELLPAIPILLATGRADSMALDLVNQFPFVTLLSKPYSVRDLKQYLYPLLS